MLKGIDVSKWQGTIDWEKVKADGIDFAIIRAGYGGNKTDYDDKYYETNTAGCEKVGMPYGVYLFSYATSVEGAVSEAEHIIRLVKGKKLSYPIFYDLEDSNTTGKCSDELILEIAKAFVEKVEAAGYTVGIYANKNWNQTKLTDSWYNTKPRWIAQYNSKCTYTGNYDIWQYSSTGKVDGISGNVDMDYCYTDYVKTTTSTSTTANATTTTTTTSAASSYKAGQAVTLSKTSLYATSTSKTASGTKTGTFYLWSASVVNNRIRITNSKDNVGKSGQVTGWINVSDIGTAKTTISVTTTSSTSTSTSTKEYKKGDKVTVTKKKLYASSTAKTTLFTKTGTYYIYDGKKVNGRYRVTNKAANVGKEPAALYVSGWMEF